MTKINSKIKKGNWIVLYYSDYCGYCSEFMPIWELFVKKKYKNLNKLKVDVNSDMVLNSEIDGVPTIHFYKNGKLTPTGIFNEERTLDKLSKFCIQNLKSKIKKTKKKNKIRN